MFRSRASGSAPRAFQVASSLHPASRTARSRIAELSARVGQFRLRLGVAIAQFIDERLGIGRKCGSRRTFPSGEEPPDKSAKHDPDSQTDEKVEHGWRMPWGGFCAKTS